jgi:hypothetical protein
MFRDNVSDPSLRAKESKKKAFLLPTILTNSWQNDARNRKEADQAQMSNLKISARQDIQKTPSRKRNNGYLKSEGRLLTLLRYLSAVTGTGIDRCRF